MWHFSLYALHIFFVCLDGECVDRCEEGSFVNEKSRQCEPCHRSCRSCRGPRYNDCDSCEDGFMLRNGECSERSQRASSLEKHFKKSKCSYKKSKWSFDLSSNCHQHDPSSILWIGDRLVLFYMFCVKLGVSQHHICLIVLNSEFTSVVFLY